MSGLSQQNGLRNLVRLAQAAIAQRGVIQFSRYTPSRRVS